MNINELRQLKADKVAEVRSLNESNKIDEAEKVLAEVRGLDKQIKIAEELESEELREMQEIKAKKEERGAKVETAVNKAEKVNEMRAITKFVMGKSKEMSTEERSAITTSSNSAVIPKAFINELQEIKRGFGSLKSLCQVVPVTLPTGTIPVFDHTQNSLSKILEGSTIVDGTLATTQLSYAIDKYGLLQELTSELIDDAQVEIESLVRTNFAEITTIQENVQILKEVDSNSTAVAMTDYQDITNTMDSALPAVKSGLITLTNTRGYAYLKNMKDAQKRPLNLITNINGQDYFNGKPIYVFDDSLVTVSEGITKLFYTLNMSEAIKFMDREQITIARSVDAGFANDTIVLRILERFDVIPAVTRSINKYELA
ncbi:phage major capsid protein [Clostridium sp.]|uniref:phage major capsid protein n=1 Tax=Clostridium sp. TaxID=1506 RepID=UPI00261CE811|nr:phage major capsid protein [Clostridium sp.]